MTNDSTLSPSVGSPSRPFIKRIILCSGVVVLLGASWWLLTRHTLDATQTFIESRFSREIARIESAMKAVAFAQRDDYAELDRVSEELGNTLTAPEIFTAAWSYDGHHGLYGLTPLPMPYSTYTRFSWPGPSRTLCYGKAENGDELFVYLGCVDAPVMRHYKVAFYATPICKLMNDEQNY